MPHRKQDKHTHASFEKMHKCTRHKLHRILGVIRHERVRGLRARTEQMWAATVFELGARTVEAWVEDRKTAQRSKRTQAGIRQELRDAFAAAHTETVQRHPEMNGRLHDCTLQDLLNIRQPVKMSAFMVNCLPDKYSGYENRLLTALATVVRKKVQMKKKIHRERAVEMV